MSWNSDENNIFNWGFSNNPEQTTPFEQKIRQRVVKTKLYIGIIGMFAIPFLIISAVSTSGCNQKNKPQRMYNSQYMPLFLNKKVVILKNTFLITDYSTTYNTFTLFNGTKQITVDEQVVYKQIKISRYKQPTVSTVGE